MDIKQYFSSLNLKEWEIIGNINGGGQSHTIQVNHISSKEKGVFRVLKKPTEVDIKRFKREIKTLTDPKFKHQNIVEILDYTKSETDYWYVSKLGSDFNLHWGEIQEKYSDNPNQLCSEAIKYIIALLEGLKILHEQKVIHRDIKPKNIIIGKEGPQLIDFGLLLVEGEERLSPLNDAVGNARFSHDTQMNRLDEVPAWLDVFQISQLLIWMLQETPDKSWTRPLHWAYVVYPKLMSQENVLKLKAITSVCSEPTLSPKDANEMLTLIHSLFISNNNVMENDNNTMNNLKEIVATRKAKEILQNNKDYEIISSSLDLFLSVFTPLYDFLVDFSNGVDCNQLDGHPVIASLSTINEKLERKLFDRVSDVTLVQLYFGNRTNGDNFYIYLGAELFPPSTLETDAQQYIFIENQLPWGFYITKNGNSEKVKKKFSEKSLEKHLQFRITNQGQVIELENNSIITTEEIKSLLNKLIHDQASFEAL